MPMPRNDVTYEAMPSSRAFFLARRPPCDASLRANTALQFTVLAPVLEYHYIILLHNMGIICTLYRTGQNTEHILKFITHVYDDLGRCFIYQKCSALYHRQRSQKRPIQKSIGKWEI